MIGGHLLEPVVIPGRLNSESFLNLLENDLPVLLEDIPLEARREIWFQLDGCPVHSSRRVRQWLNTKYPEQWIGRYGPSEWPARSPDLTPLDFYVWGRLKTLVYSEPVNTRNELVEKIFTKCNDMRRNRGEIRRAGDAVLKRSRLCRIEGGGNFEHLL